MLNSGIPEKVIAEALGHRSTKALRCFECTSQQQKQAVTKVINSSECVQTKQEMEYCGKENCKSKVAIPLEEKQSVIFNRVSLAIFANVVWSSSYI